jgi:hypothetical protein
MICKSDSLKDQSSRRRRFPAAIYENGFASCNLLMDRALQVAQRHPNQHVSRVVLSRQLAEIDNQKKLGFFFSLIAVSVFPASF